MQSFHYTNLIINKISQECSTNKKYLLELLFKEGSFFKVLSYL